MHDFRNLSFCVAFAAVFAVPPVGAQAQDPMQLRASISTTTRYVAVGKPVWIDFTLANLSSEPLTLTVPDTQPGQTAAIMGLPLTHVFSGRAFSGLTIENDSGRRWDAATDYHPPNVTEVVEVAPYSSVGISVDVAAHYPTLRAPGRYRLRWEPYGGTLRSNELVIDVAPRKQAVLLTDHGEMTLKLFYDEAPKHVENFLELAGDGFYDNLTFHRVVKGTLIQGGCPRGDGRGIRPDGKKIEAEFNDLPQDPGAVSMALARSADPDSASCQFLIVNTRISEWDGKFTVFAHLVGDESYETLDQLMNVPVDQTGERPERRLYIRGMRLEDERGEEPPLPVLSPTGPTS